MGGSKVLHPRAHSNSQEIFAGVKPLVCWSGAGVEVCLTVLCGVYHRRNDILKLLREENMRL